MKIEDLEAAVRAAWDREAIAIYADHLQAIGDPRGELVAIDLRIDDGNVGPEVTTRREQLIAEWFGAALPPGIVRYGFVDVHATGMRSDSQLAIALRGPGAQYIRSVELAGPQNELLPALNELVAEPRPWLTKLVVHQWDARQRPTLSRELSTALPALRSLELSGTNVLVSERTPPTLERMRITGISAHSALIDPSTIWPALTTLDLAFHCQYAPTPSLTNQRVQTLLAAHCVPALRELDLSRNGRGTTEPHSLGGEVKLDEFLARYAGHAALAHVHLPQIHVEDRYQPPLEALPALREVTIYDTSPLARPAFRGVKINALEHC